MIKEKLKRNTLIYKIYLYYQIYLKEKSFIKRRTYSQWGEDLIIEKYFKKSKVFLHCKVIEKNNIKKKPFKVIEKMGTRSNIITKYLNL